MPDSGTLKMPSSNSKQRNTQDALNLCSTIPFPELEPPVSHFKLLNPPYINTILLKSCCIILKCIILHKIHDFTWMRQLKQPKSDSFAPRSRCEILHIKQLFPASRRFYLRCGKTPDYYADSHVSALQQGPMFPHTTALNASVHVWSLLGDLERSNICRDRLSHSAAW